MNESLSKKVLVFLAILLFAVFVFPASGIGSSENLVSNIDGKIRVIIFHYGNGGYFSGLWFDMSVLYRDLMDKMDPDVGFVILVGTDDKVKYLKKNLASYSEQKLPDGSSRLKYLQVNVKTGRFYPWARDGYFILTDPENNLVFLDAGFKEKPFPITNFGEIFAGARTRAGAFRSSRGRR